MPWVRSYKDKRQKKKKKKNAASFPFRGETDLNHLRKGLVFRDRLQGDKKDSWTLRVWNIGWWFLIWVPVASAYLKTCELSVNML